jgi:ketosteroid isomerase-like protein
MQSTCGLLKKVLFAAAAFGLLSHATEARQKAAREPRAVREIRAVLDRQVEAWNRRDLEGFMSGYWRSPQLSFYSVSAKTSGWQQTLDRYRERYQSAGREMGTLDFSEVQIEMLGPASAYVRGRWHLKMSASEPGGLFTLIVRKIDGAWKIVHDHTSSAQ